MKKFYLALGALLLTTLTFGQLEKPTKTIPTTTTATTFASGEKVNFSESSESGLHDCSSHDLTQEYYESVGLWDEFQADYATSILASKTIPPAYRTPGTNTISIIFHVVHNPDNPAENVSYADIMNVYDDLVEDYLKLNADTIDARTGFGFIPANPNINFCLATKEPDGTPLAEEGVIRVATTEDWYNSDGGEENKMKSSATGGSQIWNRNNYLNVWICDISNGASFGVAGYAYRPSGGLLPGATIDGIVLDYNLGIVNDNVLTHEVGHYLGLDHTWGGSGSCGLDDGFADTPNTAGPSFDYSGSCSGSQTTCGAIQTQYENYMDYSNCTVMFTEDQADYMLFILNGIRSSLLLSPGCDPVEAPPVSAFTAFASGSSPYILASGGAITLQDESTNLPTGWAWTISGTSGVDWNYISGTNSSSQNPVVEFYNVGFYDVELTASNAYGTDLTPADSVGFVQVVAPSVGSACDTLRNYDPATENLAAYILEFSGFSDWGYLPGTGAYDFGGGTGLQDITRYADLYVAPTSSEVRRLIIPVLQADDNSGSGEVRISVRNDDAGGVPGTLIVEDTFAIADMTAGFFNEFNFSSPGTVAGNFWLVYEFDYGAPQDTVIFGCVNFGDRGATTGLNTMFMETNGTWYEPTDLYSTAWVTSMYVDVLLSNGADPVADFIFSESEICLGGEIDVNSSPSTNATDFTWYQTTDPGVSPVYIDSLFNGAATTFTFTGPTAGDYGIYLLADGACKTSAAILTVTVNENVSYTSSINHTSCGYNNGSITLVGAGGDGTYEYSINGGASFTSSGVFTGLAAGDYNIVVRTNGSNCEITGVITINSSSAFTAGITASSAICPGDTKSLTATGGVSYEWFEGGTSISTSSTISVTPAVTTSYNCIVTNGAGCQSIVFVTVTVNPLDDASFNFYDFCFGSPNSAVDIATPGGTFSFSPAPGDGATINPTTGEISGESLFTTYSVMYSVADVCANTSIETVTVNSVDDASFITSNYCEGGVNVVSGVATPGGTFSYDGSDASSINPTTGVITGGVAGTSYAITYSTPPGICSVTSSPTTITVLANPVISLTASNDPLCNGEATGNINITVTGAVPDSYNWGASGTSEDLTGVGAGTYTVVVTAAGCTDTETYTLTDPAAITIDPITTTNVLCNGGTSGTAITTASGGTGSLSFDYGAADNSALAAGLYNVTVTDDNGCTETQAFTITEPSAISITGVITNDDGSGNGAINITIAGGVPPYDPISWSNGANTEDISGLSAGSYTVTVTDANGCVQTATFQVLSTVGIAEENSITASLYPNPTNGILNISLLGEFNYTIMDARGRIVIQSQSTDNEILDLSEFESGVYFIQLQQGSKILSKKIILE